MPPSFLASSEAGSAAGTSRRWSLGSTRGRCVERIPSWSDPRRRAVHGFYLYAWYVFVREGFIVSSRAPKVVLARTLEVNSLSNPSCWERFLHQIPEGCCEVPPLYTRESGRRHLLSS